MALLIIPVSAAFVALAVPAMRAITVDSQNHNVDLLAAAIASLGIGLLPYSVFLLLARALYARGDSRTPAIVALVTACLGVGFMTVDELHEPRQRPACWRSGYGHSLAYLLGAVALGFVLHRRLREPLFPSALPLALITSVVLGVAAWGLFEALGTMGRVATIALLVGVGVVGAAIYVGVLRLVRGQGMPTLRASAAATQDGKEKPADRS